MSENLPSGDSVTLIERLNENATHIWHLPVTEGLLREAADRLAVLELRESERSKDLDASKVGGVNARPPDSFWREVPCGHPQDPVAWHSPDGHFVCHCGWSLDLDDGFTADGAPGPVVPCGKCGCYVALGINFTSESPSEQAGTETRPLREGFGLHQPHPAQEKPGTGSLSERLESDRQSSEDGSRVAGGGGFPTDDDWRSWAQTLHPADRAFFLRALDYAAEHGEYDGVYE